METENIDKLRVMEKNRNSANGYLVNKSSMHIGKGFATPVIKNNDDEIPYINACNFAHYIQQALTEKEKEILQLAYEIEQKEYNETKRLAKIEAAKIISG